MNSHIIAYIFPTLKMFFFLNHYSNKAIADYLYTNGFQGALEHFQKEAGMVLPFPLIFLNDS